MSLERCPGGYLIRGSRLCGPTGNNCRDVCAFEYRRHAYPAGGQSMEEAAANNFGLTVDDLDEDDEDTEFAPAKRVAPCQCCSQVRPLRCGPSRFGEQTWACDECWADAPAQRGGEG
jgi:hypothetical protein